MKMSEKQMKILYHKKFNLTKIKPDTFYLLQTGSEKRAICKTKDGKLEFYKVIVGEPDL